MKQVVRLAMRNARGWWSHLVVFRQRLASGLSWNLLSAISLQGSVLISSVLVARILGLASFGTYSVLVVTVMTIAAIAQSGSGLVATKFVGENLATNKLRVARVLRICRDFTLAAGVVASLLMMAAAGSLSEDILRRPELEPLVRLIGISAFFHTAVAYQFGALQGFGAFRPLSRVSAIVGLAHIALNAAGAWLDGIHGALSGFVAASVVRFIAVSILLRAVRREHKIPAADRLQAQEWRMVLHFALPAGLAGMVTMPCLWLVTLMVARLPDGTAAVAILTAAHQLRTASLQLPSLLNTVSFALMSRLKGQNEAAEYKQVFWSGFWMNLAFATVVIVALGSAAEQVLNIFGRDFAAGRWVLILLLASVIPELLGMVTYQLVQSAGHMWRSLFFIVAPRDFSYLAIATAIIPTQGIAGAAAAYLAAQAIGLGATVAIARHHASGPWRQSAR